MLQMKLVNGVAVPLSQEDLDQQSADSATFAAGAEARALTALAAKRYAVETGGILVTSLGFPVKTDSDSQSKLGNIMIAVGQNLAPNPMPFKASDGTFHAITPQQAAEVYAAVAQHVADCFANESMLAAAIALSQAPESVDITTGWPATA